MIQERGCVHVAYTRMYQRLKRVSVELVQWPTRQIDRSRTGRVIDPYVSVPYEIES